MLFYSIFFCIHFTCNLSVINICKIFIASLSKNLLMVKNLPDSDRVEVEACRGTLLNC